MIDLLTILTQIDDFMYFPVLIIVMAAAGLYFTIRTRGVQIRLALESVRLILEPKEDDNSVSSLQAMLVSTASRVGTGNIIGQGFRRCSRKMPFRRTTDENCRSGPFRLLLLRQVTLLCNRFLHKFYIPFFLNF